MLNWVFKTKKGQRWSLKVRRVSEVFKSVLPAFTLFALSAVLQPLPSLAQDPLVVFKLYVKQAEQGSAASMNKVAQYYHYGINMSKDLATARAWYLKAAENGFVYSQHLVGDFYVQGIGGPKDLKQAAFWYEQAASLGYLRSQLALAKLYLDPKGLYSLQKAKLWCELLAQAGDAWGQYQLAMLLNQSPSAADKRQAGEWLQKAAVQGHAQAKSSLQKISPLYREAPALALPNLEADMKRVPDEDAEFLFQFGLNWQQGRYGKRDLNAADYYFRRAALKNHVEAQYHYALSLLSGYDDTHSTEKIMEWTQKAAQQGHPKAQYLLGQLYLRGYGPPKNLGRAKYWFEQAAKNKVSEAFPQIQKLAQIKSDVPLPEKPRERTIADMSPDEVLAMANSGNRFAQFYLGSQHASKFAYPKYVYDPQKSEFWLTKSAEQGYVQAQFYLGLYYSTGTIFPKNLEKAIVWLNKAAGQGHQASANRLKEIRNLSEPQ